MAASDNYQQTIDEERSTLRTDQCPDCGGRAVTENHETICHECGLILEEDRLDRGPDWRTFEGESGNRAGAPLTAGRHDRGLSSEIGRFTDGHGNRLSQRKRRQLNRLRREHGRAQWRSKREQNLAVGLGEVRRITGALGLPKTIREQACQLFRSAQNEDLLRGRSIESMAAASVYGACRCNGFSRSLEEVVTCARVEYSRVKHAYNVLNTELGLPARPPTPGAFIPTMASRLEVSTEIQQRAYDLATLAEENGLSIGRRPQAFAMACVYTAAREHGMWPTQRDVASLANISPNTLRKHWKALERLT
ncbi:transcription initiation factor IIB [Natronobiforma cellulositropha]|uniref:transcription initiation factor IIB n=1 Tax=Natronobiforma cellulositropha TaxID=1679076 RepID=UPI0021D58C2B|nr:transcription initiation factor IIB family protein [Natronobiforma cellulositropha]